ncbi:FAD-dependent oxidoreductase [bacterium]|nr:FAD-dependent oxidoreductase [bacterium]MBT4578206.1 FAD-dependent oxidoreductase [bacterium]MBT6528820.1 FAD-dependent oxidoreductase [bacterium]
MKRLWYVAIGLLIILVALWGLQRHLYQEPVAQDEYRLAKVAEYENVVPLLVLGSGPAGLSAALYAGRANMPSLVLEGDQPGGLLTTTTQVDNWPGIQDQTGPKIIKQLRDQAKTFGARMIRDTAVQVDLGSWPFVVHTQDGKTLQALSLVIATGAYSRTLGIPGEKKYWGNGVSVCAICDAPYYKDKEVIVVGGGDSAFEEAMQLAAYAKKVWVVMRGNQARASANMKDRLVGYSNIEIIGSKQLRSISGDGNKVTGVVLQDSATGVSSEMDIDGVFLAIGHIPNTAMFAGQLDLDLQNYLILKDRSQVTSLPGVFAAGDVHDRVYQQAGIAAGNGIKAALDALEFLNELGVNSDFLGTIEANLYDVRESGPLKPVPTATSAKQLTRMIDSLKPLLVDFYSQTCPSCLHMLPLINQASARFGGSINFIKVDVGKTPEIAKMFGSIKVPMVRLFRGGKEVANNNQAMNRIELYKFITEHLLGAVNSVPNSP